MSVVDELLDEMYHHKEVLLDSLIKSAAPEKEEATQQYVVQCYVPSILQLNAKL